jgi:hypothetical protein
MDDDGKRVVLRMRAALRLLSPDDITPMGRRILENILDDEEDWPTSGTEVCKHCSELIYQTGMGRWRHANGMYTCTIQMPRPLPKAEPN